MDSTPPATQSQVLWCGVEQAKAGFRAVISAYDSMPPPPSQSQGSSLFLQISSQSLDSIPRFPLDLHDERDSSMSSVQSPRLPTLSRKIRPLFSPKFSPMTSPPPRPPVVQMDQLCAWNKRETSSTDQEFHQVSSTPDDNLPLVPEIEDQDDSPRPLSMRRAKRIRHFH